MAELPPSLLFPFSGSGAGISNRCQKGFAFFFFFSCSQGTMFLFLGCLTVLFPSPVTELRTPAHLQTWYLEDTLRQTCSGLNGEEGKPASKASIPVSSSAWSQADIASGASLNFLTAVTEYLMDATD